MFHCATPPTKRESKKGRKLSAAIILSDITAVNPVFLNAYGGIHPSQNCPCELSGIDYFECQGRFVT
jgi:hypothetical protein